MCFPHMYIYICIYIQMFIISVLLQEEFICLGIMSQEIPFAIYRDIMITD